MNDERWRYMLDQWKRLGYIHDVPNLELVVVAMPPWVHDTWLYRLNDVWQERIHYERVEVDLFIHAVMFAERFKNG